MGAFCKDHLIHTWSSSDQTDREQEKKLQKVLSIPNKQINKQTNENPFYI
jgi:hypothetical protein